MMRKMALAAPLALVAACNVNVGGNEAGAERGEPAANAAGKAEEGQVTVKAPGVDISVRLPESVRQRMATGSNNDILPPGVRIQGVHVEGNPDGNGTQGGSGAVDLVFASDQAPDQLAAWYRDSARADRFTVGAPRSEGSATIIEGETRRNGGRFTVRLSPREGGGSEGRLTIADAR